MSSTVDTTPMQLPTAGAATPAGGSDDWPAEVELVLSALEAAARRARRPPAVTRACRHRVPAELRLFSDTPGSAPWRLYTRDVSIRGVGFVTRDRLPLGYGGMIVLATPGRAAPSASTARSTAAATSATGGSKARSTSTASSSRSGPSSTRSPTRSSSPRPWRRLNSREDDLRPGPDLDHIERLRRGCSAGTKDHVERLRPSRRVQGCSD